ncbi:LOW QUALITY PROTEIN: hypothetical protein RJ640_022803 [Escallonia rubra]|uniref:Uncharacterized protein n=1 Tax=Escallonia rubra TaxID=112253 RepID=A0AA88SJH5_9ASTE|nr:LOW QUALITY PROTEIN: hypothetical protein RJ640_022803 [Escallonia rubra]
MNSWYVPKYLKASSFPQTLWQDAPQRFYTVKCFKCYSYPKYFKCNNLYNLGFLSLSFNRMGGSIPRVIGNLSRLQVLYLGKNRFSSELPKAIFNVSSLVILDLSYNEIEVSQRTCALCSRAWSSSGFIQI